MTTQESLPMDATARERTARVRRHLLIDRLFHWTLAGSVLTLLVTAFAPILGWDIAWVQVHWITGIVLGVIVLFHVARALIRLDLWSMLPDRKDMVSAWRGTLLTLGFRSQPPEKPGKYELMQKLYHWGIAGWIFVLIATGGVMLAKINTPFWQRSPYFLTDFQWGIVYSIHDFFALGLITLIIMHVYFAVRPDKIFLLRSMIVGWITEKELEAEHEPNRWRGERANQS